MRTTLTIAGLGFAFLASTACTTTHGEEGNFYFKYEHPGLWAFGIDVAVGTRVDVGVYEDEEATVPVDVSEAEFETVDTFEIVESEGHVLTVLALAEGDDELSVTSGDLHDHVAMSANAVTAIEWHVPDPFQVSGGVGDLAAGGTALVPFDLKNDEELLIGYGVPNVTADPSIVATLPDQVPFADVYFLHLDLVAAGTVTLNHPQGEPMTLDVVDPTTVATLEWNDFGASTVTIDSLPTTLFLDAELADGTLVFGLLGVATVQSTTPTTCTVAPSTLWGDGTYEVSGVAAGSCAIHATLGSLAADWTGDVQAGD